MNSIVKKFKQKIQKEGRSFKWFHKSYLKEVTYPYFIIQLNDEDRLHDQIKKAINKYLSDK